VVVKVVDAEEVVKVVDADESIPAIPIGIIVVVVAAVSGRRFSCTGIGASFVQKTTVFAFSSFGLNNNIGSFFGRSQRIALESGLCCLMCFASAPHGS